MTTLQWTMLITDGLNEESHSSGQRRKSIKFCNPINLCKFSTLKVDNLHIGALPESQVDFLYFLLAVLDSPIINHKIKIMM